MNDAEEVTSLQAALDALGESPTAEQVLGAIYGYRETNINTVLKLAGGGGGAQTLAQVLAAGSDADGNNIDNVGDLQVTDTLELASGDVTIDADGNFQLAGSSFAVDADSVDIASSGGTFGITTSGLDNRLRFTTDAFVIRSNAEPADGQLAANGFALWFDSTNGAAKLMVKAKQADGTVKTAAIPLS